ncbi:DUF2798 domain-containing protein, partial [Lacrimispora saccharolytica]|nr:DUF2798 domain-containing protein [Lacrimispora saccharolytica]
MPKTKIEDVIFTAIMATVMVYGMIVFNVALNTGGVVSGFTFLAATHELVFMAPIAFVLEFFVVSKFAGMLVFTVMKPTDRYCICNELRSVCRL